MLDEDGVTGQVAVNDGGITGVEVAGDAEQSTGQGLESLPSPLPISRNIRREQEKQKARARDLQQPGGTIP